MCDCDDNYCITANSVDRKARKDHKCCECRRVIEAGERYRYTSGLWRESGFDDFKQCEHCQAASKLLRAWDKETCICFSGLRDHLWEHREDIAYDLHRRRSEADAPSWLDVFRLTRRVENGWKAKRGPRKGQLMPVPSMPAAVMSESLK